MFAYPNNNNNFPLFLLRRYKGETGIQGETGLQGIDGIQGETGLIGLRGVTGLQGVTGLSIIPEKYITVITNPVTISNTNLETTVMNLSIPSRYIDIGSLFKFYFTGLHSNIATSGTLTFKMYIGKQSSQTIVLASSSTAYSNIYMFFEGYAIVRSSNTYFNNGHYIIKRSTTAITISSQDSTSTSTLELDDPTEIKITAQWQTANTNNALRIQTGYIEKIN
jgi:hypothetical protein